MFSVDQNCHSLWDVVPKLQALAAHGHRVTHFIEDIDVAFTSVGSGVDGQHLRLERERFYGSGGADWGAALFYSRFLGRLPVEIRDWEPITGMRTNALAKQLGRTVDDLFDEFSPSDNWQLIGPSYVGDRRHHRVIGDLTVAETGQFLRQVVQQAKTDMFGAFPERDCQERLRRWFAKEEQRVEELLAEFSEGQLVDLYRGWLSQHLSGSVQVDLTSRLFAADADPQRVALLEVFLRDYDLAAALYNQAIETADVRLRPLNTKEGELPFFAVVEHEQHLVRTPAHFRDGEIIVHQSSFKPAPGDPVAIRQLRAAGVRCVAGKAILLVIQVRLSPSGEPLALPYQGSLYMPAADRLAESLCEHRLLPGRLHPIVRVRFHLLDRLKALQTTIRLPAHLVPYFGKDEIPASQLGDAHSTLAAEARERLEAMKAPAWRKQWQRRSFPELVQAINDLAARRRELAADDPKSKEVRELWRRAKSHEVELLNRTFRQIARDYQLSAIDYWDSRGALLPWSIALGGEGFYQELLARADIYEEPLPQGCRDEQEKDHPEPL